MLQYRGENWTAAFGIIVSAKFIRAVKGGYFREDLFTDIFLPTIFYHYNYNNHKPLLLKTCSLVHSSSISWPSARGRGRNGVSLMVSNFLLNGIISTIKGVEGLLFLVFCGVSSLIPSCLSHPTQKINEGN